MGGNTVGELADVLPWPHQCEKQRKASKLFAKVGQPTREEDRKGSELSSLTLQKYTSLH